MKLAVQCINAQPLGNEFAIGEDGKPSVMVASFFQNDILEFSLLMPFDESLQTGDICEIEVTPCK